MFDLGKLLNNAGEVIARKNYPGLMKQYDAKEQREIDNKQKQRGLDQNDRRMDQRDLDAQLSVIRQMPDGSPQKEAAMRSLQQHPQLQALRSALEQSGKIPSGPEEPNEGLNDETIGRVGELLGLHKLNRDRQGQPFIEELARSLDNEIYRITGIDPAKESGRPSDTGIKLADMLAGYPQDQKRTGWGWFGDDTVSEDNIKQGAKNFVETLTNSGVPKEDARKLAVKQYGELTAGDNNRFQRYPKMDISKMFTDEDTRQQAQSTGVATVDTGDGRSTIPSRYKDIGIKDPDMLEHFTQLEKTVSKALPDFDLKADYQQNPQFYQELFDTIKNGVPDGKGGTRKLSVDEIIGIIKGEIDG